MPRPICTAAFPPFSLLPTRVLRLLLLPLGRPATLCHAPANKMQAVHVEGGHHHPLYHNNQTGLRERPLTGCRCGLHEHAHQTSPNLGHRGARDKHGRMGTSETKHETSTGRQATVQSKQCTPTASQQGAAGHLGCKEMAGQLLNAWKLVFVSPPPVTSSPVHAVVSWDPFPPQILLHLLLNSVQLQLWGWRPPPTLPSCPPV